MCVMRSRLMPTSSGAPGERIAPSVRLLLITKREDIGGPETDIRDSIPVRIECERVIRREKTMALMGGSCTPCVR